ncbi:MAG: protein kinase [Chloroflexales bacterium]
MHHRGAYVEVVGRVIGIAHQNTKDGKPYAFINFGDWTKGCFRLVLWSEALSCFAKSGVHPQTFAGQWVGVRGVLETFRGSRGIEQLQIAPDQPAQTTVFGSEAEAEQRCRASTGDPPPVSPPRANTPAIGQTIALHPVPLVCSYCTQPIRDAARICSQCGAPRNPPTRLHPGDLLNQRYTIKRALSRGGMGEIYLAVDSNVFGRHVVVKIMLDYFDTENATEVRAAQQMFEREAQTLANLSHAAVPKIYDFFRAGADALIVMEHIAGDNLEKQLTHADLAGRKVVGQPYPIETGIRYGIEVARVLQYLATITTGPVVHHDIKPANLLLDPTGIVRLVDFGTARPRVAAKGNAKSTQQTTIYGTPGYAPPEQYQGKTEPRSDVYALAATIYHMVTDDDPNGHPCLFPRLSQLGELGQVLTAALHERVDQRQDAQTLAVKLQQLLDGKGEATRRKAQREDAEAVRRQQALLEAERRKAEEATQRQLEAQRETQRRKAEEAARQQQIQLADQRRKAEEATRQQQIQLETQRRQAMLRHAPDGTLLLSALDLVNWSEHNWQRALDWLADEQGFLQQISAICGAEQESILRASLWTGDRNRNLVLDGLLAQLDPKGFGLEQPQIGVDQKQVSLDFGILKPTEEYPIAVMVKNTSRRYLQFAIRGPAWIHLLDQPISLLPGEERAVTFIAQTNPDSLAKIEASTVEFWVDGTCAGARMRVTARVPQRDFLAWLQRIMR